jgi:hypothetical protein
MDAWGNLIAVFRYEIESYGAQLISNIPSDFGGGTHVSVSTDLLHAVEQLPEMKAVNGTVVFRSNGLFCLDSRLVSEALIRNGVSVGVDVTLTRLSKFFRTNYSRGAQIVLLGGLNVNERITLGEGLFLCPPEQVPNEEFQLQHSKSKDVNHSIFLRKFDLSEKKVVGAAMIRICQHPRFIPSSPAPKFQHDSEFFLAEQLLTLIGPSSPIKYRDFYDLDHDELLRGSGGDGYSWTIEETRVHKNMTLQAADFEGFATLVLNFSRLTDDDRTHLAVSLHRLSEAVRHSNDVDKALDLGIALESLLLSGQKEKEQLALQFRLRGAWLLGNDGMHRATLYQQFKELYDLRSMAAHSGKVELKKGSVSDALTHGLKLCAEAIKRIILRGGFPDWGALVVGADYVIESKSIPD